MRQNGASVRKRGDAALVHYARRFDRLEGPLEVSRGEIDGRQHTCLPRVRAAIAAAARNIEKVGSPPTATGMEIQPQPGVSVEQRVAPLGSARVLRPWRAVSPVLVSLDDRDSRSCRRGGGGNRGLPSPQRLCWPPPVRPVSAACFVWGGLMQSPRLRMARQPFHASTRSSAREPVYVAAAKALVAKDLAIDYARPNRRSSSSPTKATPNG